MSIAEFGSLLSELSAVLIDFLISPPISYFVGVGLILVTVVALKKIMF